MRLPGIEPRSTAWKATMLTVTPQPRRWVWAYLNRSILCVQAGVQLRILKSFLNQKFFFRAHRFVFLEIVLLMDKVGTIISFQLNDVTETMVTTGLRVFERLNQDGQTAQAIVAKSASVIFSFDLFRAILNHTEFDSVNNNGENNVK